MKKLSDNYIPGVSENFLYIFLVIQLCSGCKNCDGYIASNTE
jgi:hypothetical protein